MQFPLLGTWSSIMGTSWRPNPAVYHNESRFVCFWIYIKYFNRWGKLVLKAIKFFLSSDNYEWTTWFNVDHPGGKGDYEKLNVIRFYYRARVCEVPRALEARTTEWIPARSTGERVHADPAEGFWCVNDEQPVGRNCSNYAVRFLCPKGK